jgi:Na+:H+ antiporter, NhaA family
MTDEPSSPERVLMTARRGRIRLDDPLSAHLRREFTPLRVDQTVGAALDWLRKHPPPGPIIYFYVVDADGRLQGVVPTRGLILHSPDTPLADIMIRRVVALPVTSTVLDACEFFVQHRLLGFPVVDDDQRLLGVVDVDLYTNALAQLEEARPVEKWVRTVGRFFQVEAAGGLVLLACVVAALVLANSPWAEAFTRLWQTPVRVGVGGHELDKPLLLWINDGLMTIFFFVVGLEIKRELVAGELRDPRKVMLPVVAALGGMVVPAAIYLLLQAGRPGAPGWGIPMATDIAFVVGFLALFGPRVPVGLKILLLSLAIVDDLGAVLVIAVVYTADLFLPALGLAALGLGAVVALRWLRIRSVAVYAFLGAGVWLGFLKSGVHPTVAGVLLGLLTPARPLLGGRVLLDVQADLSKRSRGDPAASPPDHNDVLSPAERLEEALHPWVAFVIVPLFALANAGVALAAADLSSPVALAVIAGLALGKPLGIVLASWAAVKAGVARLPEQVSWKVMLGAGLLGGIGFTMSLFIAGLALHGPLLEEAKVGTFTGSAASAALGSLLLLWWLPRTPSPSAKPRVAG